MRSYTLAANAVVILRALTLAILATLVLLAASASQSHARVADETALAFVAQGGITTKAKSKDRPATLRQRLREQGCYYTRLAATPAGKKYVRLHSRALQKSQRAKRRGNHTRAQALSPGRNILCQGFRTTERQGTKYLAKRYSRPADLGDIKRLTPALWAKAYPELAAKRAARAVAPAAAQAQPAASQASALSAPAAGGGSPIPQYIVQCESGGSYDAYNPSSGAYGRYQIIPSTAAAYGCNLSTPGGQDACAAEIWRNDGASAWDCG